MKVIILNSPIYREKNYIKEDYLPPIGLGYIATYLNKNNINVSLIDCVYEHLGIIEIHDIIKKNKPDFVVINIFTQNMNIVKNIIENCKINCSFIIGGQVTKFIYNEIIEWNSLNDINIIIGEGEYIIKAIIKDEINEETFLEKENKRVYNVDKNSVYFPYDISKIELNRNFFKNRNIKNIYNKKEVAIITSRGCIYNCAFCGGARSLNNNITIRERNKESIINEINDILYQSKDVTSIRVLDDLFLKNRFSIKKAIDIFSNFDNLSWRAMAHVLSFKKAIDILPTLKASGCEELFIGIESGSQDIRRKINKLGSIEEIKKVIYKILESGINVKGYFIYGFPDENINDLEKTYQLAKSLKDMSYKLKGTFRTSVFQFRPYHGTELYNRIKKSKREISECILNDSLSNNIGRNQFNYQSGNYSNCTQDEVNQYINKTLELNNGV